MEKFAGRKKKDRTPEHTEKIRQAGNSNRVVGIVYTDKKGNITDRLVEPYKIDGDDFWGFSLDKNEIRRFKLPQVGKVRMTKKKYEPRWTVEMNPGVEKIAAIKKEIYKIAKENKNDQTKKILEDGGKATGWALGGFALNELGSKPIMKHHGLADGVKDSWRDLSPEQMEKMVKDFAEKHNMNVDYKNIGNKYGNSAAIGEDGGLIMKKLKKFFDGHGVDIGDAFKGKSGSQADMMSEFLKSDFSKNPTLAFLSENEAISLHELGHLKNSKGAYAKNKIKIPHASRGYVTGGSVMLPMMSSQFRDMVRKVDGDKQYADKVVDFVEKHPYLASYMAVGHPLLIEEGRASAYALKELSKKYGVVKGLKNGVPKLIPAYATYLGHYAKPAAAMGLAFNVINANDPRKKQEKTAAFLDGIYKEAKVKSPFQKFKENQVPLTPEERAEVMDGKAVWHFNGGSPSPAVWKSVDKDGNVTYVTHTHRAYNTAPTLKGAITRYHKFIKSTAGVKDNDMEKVAAENDNFFYHASPVQDIKKFRLGKDTSGNNKGDVVFASKFPEFSSAFGIRWHDGIARLVVETTNKQVPTIHNFKNVVLKVSDKVDLDKPCSMYKLKGNFKELRYKDDIEYYTNDIPEIISEEKFNSYKDMAKSYGLEIRKISESTVLQKLKEKKSTNFEKVTK